MISSGNSGFGYTISAKWSSSNSKALSSLPNLRDEMLPPNDGIRCAKMEKLQFPTKGDVHYRICDNPVRSQFRGQVNTLTIRIPLGYIVPVLVVDSHAKAPVAYRVEARYGQLAPKQRSPGAILATRCDIGHPV